MHGGPGRFPKNHDGIFLVQKLVLDFVAVDQKLEVKDAGGVCAAMWQ